MMSMEMFLEKVEALGADADYYVYEDVVRVYMQDWDGFDEDYSEVMRDYDFPELVEEFEKMVESHDMDDDGYYVFDGFRVDLCYSSLNI